MESCPLCDVECASLEEAASHVLSAHQNSCVGPYPDPKFTLRVRRPGDFDWNPLDFFALLRCWCGRWNEVWPTDPAQLLWAVPGFVGHLADRGGLTQHVMEVALGLFEWG